MSRSADGKRPSQRPFHARLDLRPVLLVQELGLELFELALGRADQIAVFPGAQEIDVVLAEHASIDHPDAFGLPILFLH